MKNQLNLLKIYCTLYDKSNANMQNYPAEEKPFWIKQRKYFFGKIADLVLEFVNVLSIDPQELATKIPLPLHQIQEIIQVNSRKSSLHNNPIELPSITIH